MNRMVACAVDDDRSLDVVPGSVVIVRDEEWLVTQVAETQDGAAIMLGLRETLGGAPTHLDAVQVPFTVADADGGDVRTAVLLHDTVPGGTGYLAELASPAWLWEVLVTAARIVEECACREERRSSCLLPFARGSSRVDRAVAQQAVVVLLGVEEEETLADLDPRAPRWIVEDKPVVKGSGESPLEQKFRTARAKVLKDSAKVKEEPTPTGIRLRISGLGQRVWTLTPQVLAHGTKPDFLLESTGVKPVATDTDGQAYHASAAVNRLTDDAQKRATLRAHGYHVVALTNRDVAGQTGPPSWLEGKTVTTLLAQPAGSPGAGNHLRGRHRVRRWTAGTSPGLHEGSGECSSAASGRCPAFLPGSGVDLDGRGGREVFW